MKVVINDVLKILFKGTLKSNLIFAKQNVSLIFTRKKGVKIKLYIQGIS